MWTLEALAPGSWVIWGGDVPFSGHFFPLWSSRIAVFNLTGFSRGMRRKVRETIHFANCTKVLEPMRMSQSTLEESSQVLTSWPQAGGAG